MQLILKILAAARNVFNGLCLFQKTLQQFLSYKGQ